MGQNSITRFVLNDIGIRGAVVELSDVLGQMTQNRAYSPEHENLLHRSAVSVCLLGSILKIKGSIGLELRGVEGVKYLVSQLTNDRQLRGMLQPLEEQADVGAGQVIISIEPEDGQKYQGLVGYSKEGVAKSIEDYFTHSEQLDTYIAIGGRESKLIGVLAQPLADAKVDENWREQIKIADLLDTLAESDKETEDAIAHYFMQHEYLVYPAEGIVHQCKCSRDKSLASIETIGQDEIRQFLAEDGQIITTCGFCGQSYQFDEKDFDFI